MEKDNSEEYLAAPGECFVRRKGCSGKATDPGTDSRLDSVNAYLDAIGLKPWEACPNCRENIRKEMEKIHKKTKGNQ